MERSIPELTLTILDEINVCLPGPINRLISGYLCGDQYRVSGKIIEIPDVMLLFDAIIWITPEGGSSR